MRSDHQSIRRQLDVNAEASPTLESIRDVVREEISFALTQQPIGNRLEPDAAELRQMKVNMFDYFSVTHNNYIYMNPQLGRCHNIMLIV